MSTADSDVMRPTPKKSSSLRSRPHSSSISSVHFEPRQHPSASSLRSQISLLQQSISEDRQLSPLKTRSTPVLGSSPPSTLSATDLTSPLTQVPAPNLSPRPRPQRHSSQERRVRSEAYGAPAQHRMSMPPLKRPSVVTGGYESTTDADSSDDRPKGGMPNSHSQPLLQAPDSDSGRRRAHSLIAHHDGSRSPSREGSTSDRLKIRTNGLVKSPLGSPGASRTPSTATIGASRPQAGPSGSRVPSQSTKHPFPKPEAHSATSSRHPSTRIKTEDVPSRSTSTRLREGEKHHRVHRTVTPSSSSDKGKQRAADERPSGLAAGLGFIEPKVTLSVVTDQIHALLDDTDLASAVRMINTNRLGPTLRPTLPDPVSSFSTQSSFSANPSGPTPFPSHTAEPYLVSAPPALTEVDHHRDRTVSMSSTIAPYNITPRSGQRSSFDRPSIDRRTRDRRMSSVTGEPPEGHLPFTHHVPVSDVMEDESVDGNESASPDELSSKQVNGSLRRSGSLATRTVTPDKKSRFSQLFSRKKKKSPERTKPIAPPVVKHDHHEHKDHAAKEREEEIRRLERERREAELAQERRFRALTQVAAHPTAERLAYKASSHLRAYYSHVYDGVEDPPRLNPLAVLRWKEKTEIQREAKKRWQAEQRNPSPNKQVYPHAIHSSPVSMDSLSRVRSSLDSARPTSLQSPVNRTSPLKPRRETPKEPAHAWRYTVDDIEAYKEADGVVNYFIPPRPTVVFSDDPISEGGSRHESSAGESMRKHDSARQRVVSASVLSLADVEPTSTAGSVAPLSRTTSMDRPTRKEHHFHRSHQSLGMVGPAPGSLSQALRAPLDIINRRQRVSPVRHDKGEVHSDHLHIPLLRHQHGSGEDEHSSRSRLAASKSFFQAAPVTKSKEFIRRNYHSQGSLTDDEHRDREFGFKKLFKGQGREERRMSAPTEGNDKENGTKESDRETKSQLTSRPVDTDTIRRSERDKRTQARVGEMEAEVYAARKEHLRTAKERIERLDLSLSNINESMRHYLSQAERLKQGLSSSAGIETHWPSLSPLFKQYMKHPRVPSEGYGESQDVLSPLRDSDLDRKVGRSTSRTRSRRRTTNAPLPALFEPTSGPWSLSISPSVNSFQNPFDRLQTSLDSVKGIQSQMMSDRQNTTSVLQDLNSEIEALIKQKDAVRAWTKSVLEKNRSLQSTLETLRRTSRGSRARMGRMKDRIYDATARGVAAPLVRSTFGLFVAVQYIVLRPFVSTLESPFRRYPRGSLVVISGLMGLLAYFYYIGGKEVSTV
ncbi:hypothetical protein TREMEDRAFT_60485 [Tremella mesenterica DSM 1558]|uniref:uncharacterized protein n=1 Tax=Tremella mesenterica (strain ATCC 24925 / CBS 8224 / DSM 1558 / NBRC 9311 / NRRL Y-6157 / RJB 2259-6 / UBC 559-6) TaxID=578456 RepID=UPI0003F4976F|nr:uncharacterized protein TREMEDRAFT_60485 [Tremella mesenterica DSM 1558]EIW71562.1 hypothetical protein TREMEDRAFT_60485 [Tremella mesenterica DSM 1558]